MIYTLEIEDTLFQWFATKRIQHFLIISEYIFQMEYVCFFSDFKVQLHIPFRKYDQRI